MDRLAGAFRDAALGMALVAPSGAFLRVNSTLCRLLGHTEPSCWPRACPTWSTTPAWPGAARAAPSLQTEAPLRHRDGRPVVALVSLTLVRDSRADP